MIARRGETARSRVDVYNTHISMINPLINARVIYTYTYEYFMESMLLSTGYCYAVLSFLTEYFVRQPQQPSVNPWTTWWHHQMDTFSALLAFVQEIHRSPVKSPHKGQWRGALVLSLICARINVWANKGDAGDLRLHLAHYDVIVMINVMT